MVWFHRERFECLLVRLLGSKLLVSLELEPRVEHLPRTCKALGAELVPESKSICRSVAVTQWKSTYSA